MLISASCMGMVYINLAAMCFCAGRGETQVILVFCMDIGLPCRLLRSGVKSYASIPDFDFLNRQVMRCIGASYYHIRYRSLRFLMSVRICRNNLSELQSIINNYSTILYSCEERVNNS